MPVLGIAPISARVSRGYGTCHDGILDVWGLNFGDGGVPPYCFAELRWLQVEVVSADMPARVKGLDAECSEMNFGSSPTPQMKITRLNSLLYGSIPATIITATEFSGI